MAAFIQTILSNGTIIASGSSPVFANFGTNEFSLVINVKGPVTGSTPTLTFTIQEVDPGDQTTSLGASKTGAAITGIGTQIITIPNVTSGTFIISWVVTGSTPSFGGVYATIVDKPDNPYIYDLSGNGPAAVKPASTAALTTDPALVVAISPNSNTIVTGAAADTTASGALGALNAAVQVALAGQQSVGLQLSAGTLIGTIIAEQSIDGGTTWNQTYFIDPTSKNISPFLVFSSSNTANDKSIITTGGASHVRTRVSIYTSGTATVNLRAAQIEPGFPSMGNATTYPRTTRLDRFGNTRVGFDNLLMTDAVEGTTLNSWLWSTSTLTATVNQGSSQINLNGSTTANTYAILTSNRQFQIMDHGPIKGSFYASFGGGDPNPNTMEIGFGAPTTTSTLTKGAFFRINGTTGSVDCIFGGSSVVTTSGVFVIALLGTKQAYHFIIELEDWGARFIIEDGTGNNLVDTNVFGFNGSAGSQTLQETHIPVFARVFTGVSVLTFTSQIQISAITVLGMELATNKPWSHQMASTGRSAIINPSSFAQTPQLATGAAPSSGAPSNTASLYSTMGGEFICNATATSENLLSIFGFNIPSPYTFYLTGIFIPACIVAGAATATTATVLEFAVVANATSNNISTGGGYRFTIPAQFQVASGAAIGTVFNGQPCNWVPNTPIACKPNTFLHIAYKVILGTATASNQNRGNVYIDGFFE